MIISDQLVWKHWNTKLLYKIYLLLWNGVWYEQKHSLMSINISLSIEEINKFYIMKNTNAFIHNQKNNINYLNMFKNYK